MKKKRLLLNIAVIVMLFSYAFTNAQVTIFSEDFETATGAENQASPYLGWQNGQFATTPPTNDNYFWVFDDTRCNVITGNYSMAVSRNTPVTTAPFPEYRDNRAASTLVYNTTTIDATNYTSLTLDFNWICEGEIGFDFGTVLYSLDGATWATLPGFYEGQSTVQSVTNLDLSILDGQIFYLGFGWDNDNSIGGFPSFIVDDIFVKGIALTPCIVPNQPTVLNLAPTGDTINGSFTASVPAPDNYLVVVSTSATAPTPVNTTSYNLGDTIGVGTVVDIDSDTLFTATGLNPSTLYYIYVFSYNAICSGGPLYNVASPLSGSTTTTTSTYCSPLNEQVSYNTTVKYINDVEFRGTLNDVTNINNGNSVAGYTDWTGLTNCIQAQGEGINVVVGGFNGRGRWKAWVDWNKDDVFDLTTEEVYDSGSVGTTTTTFGFGIPANQAVGDYRLRIRFHNTATDNWSYDFNACEFFDFWDDTTNAPNDGDFRLGEAEDYLFTVVQSCDAKITSLTDGAACGPGAATLIVTGSAGTTQFNWYDAETGGNLVATTGTGSWSPIISATTTYWVTANNGNCESLVRTKIVATLNPITTLTISPASPTVCGEDDIIEISATGDTELAYLIDEDFEGGGLGVFNIVNLIDNGAAQNALTEWQNRTSIFVPDPVPGLSVWKPAVSPGFGANQFVMATSDVNPVTGAVYTSLESPVVDSSTFTDLTLNLDMYFSKYLTGLDPDNVLIYASTDGGATWGLVQSFLDDEGYGTRFTNFNIDLSAYINEPNLKISIDYYAIWADGVAIDNIQLFGSRPLNPSFTWTGLVDAYTDIATTIPYVPGSTIGTVYVKPTLAQLELATFTFAANATLSNGCTISKDITITNKTKIWQGLSSNWNDTNNWKPSGVPDDTNCVIIPDKPIDPIITSGIDGDAFSLSVKDDALLTINPGASLTVVDVVNIDTLGEIILESMNGAADGSSSSVSGSLIQVDDSAVNTGTGKLTLKRNTFVRNRDYVYWSSPVADFAVTGIRSTPYIYKWNATIFVDAATQYGNWVATSENMVTAKGYIVRGGPSGNGTNDTAAWNTATFEGVPNNGLITIPILRGTCIGNGCGGTGNGGTNGTDFTEDDDNWNLVGNPYPSALSALDFLEENSNLNNRIEGTVYLWTHGTKIRRGNSPFFGEFVFNYDIEDYTEFNYSGSTGGFNGYIGSGQGFFVLMDDASASGTDLVFNNSMRDRTYESGVQFFRNSNESVGSIERHRIWLDLIPPSRNVSTSLMGYIEGASNSKDKLFDAQFMNGSAKKLYSIIEGSDKKFSIQGRSLPFEETDIIPLGIIINEEGEHAINIQAIDGLFEYENQSVFIEDMELGIIHNLNESPYFFMPTEMGEFTDRFRIRYTNNALGLDEYDTNNISISAPNNDYIKITSGNESIYSVTVIDMLGRVLINQTNINTIEYHLNDVSYAGTLLVKVILNNGQRIVKKVVIK
jgi:hypothetical protein